MPSSLELGVQAFREKRFPDAVAIFEVLVKAYPDDMRPHLLLAEAYRYNNQLSEARAIYQSVLKKSEDIRVRAVAVKGLNELPAETDAWRNAPLSCQECGAPIPEERRNQPWCACGWNKPHYRNMIPLQALQEYLSKSQSSLVIKKTNDLYSLSSEEIRIQHLSDQSSRVDPRLILRVENGLPFIAQDDLALIMPQVSDTALFRERKQGNDLGIGKLYNWDEMVDKINTLLGYNVTAEPRGTTLYDILAANKVLPRETLDQARQHAKQTQLTFGQALLELEKCSFQELLVGAIGQPLLLAPTSHLANQIGHYLYGKGELELEPFQMALISQAKKLKPLGALLSEARAISNQAARTALKQLSDTRFQHPEVDRLGERLIVRNTITRTELLQALEEQKHKKRRIGQLLLEAKAIRDEETLEETLHWQELKLQLRRQGKIRLGEILIEKKWLDRKGLAVALVRQIDDPQPLGEILVGGKNCTPEQIIEGITIQEERLNERVVALIQEEVEGKPRKKPAPEGPERKSPTPRKKSKKAQKEESPPPPLQVPWKLLTIASLVPLILWGAAQFLPSLLSGKAQQAKMARSGGQLTYEVDIDKVMEAIDEGSENPLQEAHGKKYGMHPTYQVDVDRLLVEIDKGTADPVKAASRPFGTALNATEAKPAMSIDAAVRQIRQKTTAQQVPLMGMRNVLPMEPRGNWTLSPIQAQQELGKSFVALQRNPNDTASHIRMGTLFMGQGNLAAAEKSFQSALKSNPKSATAYQQLGLLHRDLGDFSRANSELEKACQLAPLNARVQRDYGDLLQAKGEHDKAISVYQQAIAGAPNDPTAYTRIGISFREKKKYPEAISYFNQAKKIAPKSPYASYYLANTLEKNQQLPQALIEYRHSAQLLADTAYQQASKGNKLIGKRNYQGALDCFQEAIRNNGLSANAQLNLGRLHLQQRHFKESSKAFTQARQSYRKNAPLHSKMGELYQNGWRTEKAIAEYSAATIINPKLPEPYFQLGIISQQQKRPKAASEFYSKYLALSPRGNHALSAKRKLRFLRNQV